MDHFLRTFVSRLRSCGILGRMVAVIMTRVCRFDFVKNNESNPHASHWMWHGSSSFPTTVSVRRTQRADFEIFAFITTQAKISEAKVITSLLSGSYQ